MTLQFDRYVGNRSPHSRIQNCENQADKLWRSKARKIKWDLQERSDGSQMMSLWSIICFFLKTKSEYTVWHLYFKTLLFFVFLFYYFKSVGCNEEERCHWGNSLFLTHFSLNASVLKPDSRDKILPKYFLKSHLSIEIMDDIIFNFAFRISFQNTESQKCEYTKIPSF